MSAPLPVWADVPEATPLLASIVANPPECRTSYKLPSIYGGHREPCAPRYMAGKRPDVAGLKRLYRDWLKREQEALDVQFNVTGKWDQEASNAVFRIEDPDQLIHRLLTQHERADHEPKELPNGRFQVAA